MMMMETKYFTKTALIAANKAAMTGGGKHIDPAFLERVPQRSRFPVMALPIILDKGWIRCLVAVPRNLSDDVHELLLDMPGDEYDGLPTMYEMPLPT